MSTENNNPFSPQSSAPTNGPLIPNKTLAWVGIKVRGIKTSKGTGGEYADIELTVADGEYKNRKIWVMICNPYDLKNSETWRKMAVSAMTRIFEAAKVFVVNDPESYKKFANQPFLAIVKALDGIVAAVKIKVAVDKDGQYPDKNDIADWLSPNPVSSSVKDFMALVNPAQAADQNRSTFLAGATTAPAPGWNQTPATNAPATTAAPQTQPAQTTAAPEAAPAAEWKPPVAAAGGAPLTGTGQAPGWVQQ